MQIPSSLFRTFRKFANAVFEKPAHRLALNMQVQVAQEEIVLSVSYGGRRLAYCLLKPDADSTIDKSFTLPHELLETLCLADGSVELSDENTTDAGNRFTVRWQHGLVKRQLELDVVVPEELQPRNRVLSPVDSRFLQVMAQACEIADPSSVRYALDCIELDGQLGTVVATDGQHLVRFDGFEFPWQPERILIRRNRMFRLKELQRMGIVQLGVDGDGLTIAVGQWVVELPIERTVKFPATNQVIPDRQRSSNRVRLDAIDCVLLDKCLKQLPGYDAEKQPVIVDLNGHVAIIGKSNSVNQPDVCLELERCLHIGPEYRVGVCREDLGRAIKLGVDSLFLYSNGRPVLACGPQVQFVWMPLSNTAMDCDLSNAQYIRSSFFEPSRNLSKAG